MIIKNKHKIKTKTNHSTKYRTNHKMYHTRYKILGLLIVLTFSFIILSGCSQTLENTDNINVASTSNETSTDRTTVDTTDDAKDSETSQLSHIIKDMAGRTVEIPSDIKSVATLGATARLLVYAGCADRLTGVSDLEISGNPGMPYAYANAAIFSELTAVSSGGAASENYDEALLMLQPDIIITNSSDLEMVDTMQDKYNIPIVVLIYDGIFSDSVYNALNLIGIMMQTEDRCETVIASMKEWQKDLDSRTANIPEDKKPSVYAGAVSFRGGHGIEGTYGAYPPFDAIHAKNVVDETGNTGSMLIEKEKILIWNPDIIFLTPGNMGLVNEDYDQNPNYYQNLSAVQEGNIYSQINYNYYGTNIELAIADAYFAGSVIYPQAFSDVDFEAKAEEIFTTMLGKPYLEILNANGNHYGTMVIGAE